VFAQNSHSAWPSRLLKFFGNQVVEHRMAHAEQRHPNVAIFESGIPNFSDLAVIDEEHNEISMALDTKALPFTLPS
jgi:hypothetical protein